jgi:hypothetical protein
MTIKKEFATAQFELKKLPHHWLGHGPTLASKTKPRLSFQL